MRSHPLVRSLAYVTTLTTVAFTPGCARAQRLEPVRHDASRARITSSVDSTVVAASAGRTASKPVARTPEASRPVFQFKSRADSLAWLRNRALAAKSTGFRLVVSLQEFRLWAIIGADTVLNTTVAVAKGTTLEYAGREFKFETPRGMRRVLKKESDPVWQPPDWLYVETAQEHGLQVRRLVKGRPIKLGDGRSLTVKDSLVGVMENGEFLEMPTDEHIVFDNTLFIPPIGTKNRKVVGELGRHRLDLGEGYLLHGTPHKESFGMAATHGCVRLRDEDIEWLYDHVPVGTRVYIY